MRPFSLFVAIYVVLVEERWFTSLNEPYVHSTLRAPDRFERSYFLQSQLYAAPDSERAYEKAVSWSDGFGDFNHDGLGDLTAIYSTGIHDIQEVVLGSGTIDQCLSEIYGVNVGSIDFESIGQEQSPRICTKSELSIFQRSSLESQPDA